MKTNDLTDRINAVIGDLLADCRIALANEDGPAARKAVDRAAVLSAIPADEELLQALASALAPLLEDAYAAGGRDRGRDRERDEEDGLA